MRDFLWCGGTHAGQLQAVDVLPTSLQNSYKFNNWLLGNRYESASGQPCLEYFLLISLHAHLDLHTPKAEFSAKNVQ